ncbi:RNA polymerase sigma-70 factor [Puia sp.]|jgi:RNA polymerase sigma-70 factor (ECF subfamily)|uniref:RNA polymerase sigma-70 factor n=1 Tax=Puia sp. TaxID=2045100 RepID=UPI002F4041BC
MDQELAQIKQLQQKIALYEDMKAYEQLYGLLYPGLHRFACAFVKSRDTAQDIVSDVFIKLWQIRGRLMEIENLKVYLFTLARNFSYNYLTQQFKKVVLSLDEADPEVLISFDDPESLCISADAVGKIRLAIRQLPPQCRIIFQLVKEEGMKYKEVADVLHLSVLTVRNQVAIATRKIAALLPAGELRAAFKNIK